MAEKAGIAQFLDKLMEGMSKAKADSGGDIVNVLPKPDTQDIGDGVIVWRWNLLNGSVVIESVLATRQPNQQNLAKDEYVVSLKLPESENGTYSFYDDTSKDIGQAILSAYNWKSIWKINAGDFLLEELSQAPACESKELAKPEQFDE